MSAFNRLLPPVPADTLERYYTQLATMLGAGVPVRQAVRTLAEQHRGRQGRVLSAVADAVDAGAPLSTALGAQPAAFERLDVALIQTGETTGRVDASLTQLAGAAARLRRVRQRVGAALIYPVILVHAGIVLPNLVVAVQEGVGAFLAACLWVLVPLYAVVATLVAGHRALRHRDDYGRLLHRLPWLGGVLQKTAVARFTRALAALFAVGSSPATAIVTAGETTGNSGFADDARRAARKVERGSSVADSLSACRWLPRAARDIVATGELSGRLPEVLARVADASEDEAQTSLERAAVVGPLFLYLGVAAYIAWTVVSFYASYFSPLGE